MTSRYILERFGLPPLDFEGSLLYQHERNGVTLRVYCTHAGNNVAEVHCAAKRYAYACRNAGDIPRAVAWHENDDLAWLVSDLCESLCIHVRPDEQLENERIKCDLYDELIHRRLAALNLTWREAACICDVLNGSLTQDDIGWIVQEVKMGVAECVMGADAKWQIDGPGLAKRAANWDDVTCLAVRSAVTAFWERTEVPTVQALLDVRLIQEMPEDEDE